MPTPNAEYVVRLDAFEGPMDLLLHLIRREELDIHDIPIARLTDQYLEQLGDIERIDIDLAAEFLVTAATLMEIKSRMISPPPPTEGARRAAEERSGAAREAVDPRTELVHQLLAYKRCRDAANALEARRTDWERRYPAGSAGAPTATAPAEPGEPSGESPATDLDDLHLFDLVSAFARILDTVDLERAARATHEVRYDDTPIELHAEDVLDRLRRAAAEPGSGSAGAGLTLRQMVAGRGRAEIIGLFLATLELLRRRLIAMAPTAGRDDVLLTANADPEPAPIAPEARG